MMSEEMMSEEYDAPISFLLLLFTPLVSLLPRWQVPSLASIQLPSPRHLSPTYPAMSSSGMTPPLTKVGGQRDATGRQVLVLRNNRDLAKTINIMAGSDAHGYAYHFAVDGAHSLADIEEGLQEHLACLQLAIKTLEPVRPVVAEPSLLDLDQGDLLGPSTPPLDTTKASVHLGAYMSSPYPDHSTPGTTIPSPQPSDDQHRDDHPLRSSHRTATRATLSIPRRPRLTNRPSPSASRRSSSSPVTAAAGRTMQTTILQRGGEERELRSLDPVMRKESWRPAPGSVSQMPVEMVASGMPAAGVVGTASEGRGALTDEERGIALARMEGAA
jgi:hypothetical protein